MVGLSEQKGRLFEGILVCPEHALICDFSISDDCMLHL